MTMMTRVEGETVMLDHFPDLGRNVIWSTTRWAFVSWPYVERPTEAQNDEVRDAVLAMVRNSHAPH